MKGTLEPNAQEILNYWLTDEMDAEEAYLNETPQHLLTKIALARCIEIHEEGTCRKALWALKRQVLVERCMPYLPRLQPEPQEPQAKAKAKPKGKAKAAGRGRGRGRA